MSEVDKAAISCAGSVRGGAVVVGVLGTKTPTASLPKGALFNPVTRIILIAPEAIWELELSFSMLLAKDSVALQTIFPFFHIR